MHPRSHEGLRYSFAALLDGAKRLEELVLGISPLTPFGLTGILSMDDNRERPLDGLWVICLLEGLGGSSSSSLLKVRSTIGPDDRLLLS